MVEEKESFFGNRNVREHLERDDFLCVIKATRSFFLFGMVTNKVFGDIKNTGDFRGVEVVLKTRKVFDQKF